MIILDMGSGNTCKNDLDYAKRMVRTVVELDTRHREIVFKWQIFEKAGENVPLSRQVFGQVYEYARNLGYSTTASVFDPGSIEFLVRFDVPFVKMANRRDLDWLRDRLPPDVRVIRSVDSSAIWETDCLCCVSEYPAEERQYEKTFQKKHLKSGISDHTTDLTLFRKYQPEIYECHFCLDDSTGLDAGPFARRPAQLLEIL